MPFAGDRTSVTDEYDDLLEALDYFDNIDTSPPNRRRPSLPATQPLERPATAPESRSFTPESQAERTDSGCQASEAVSPETLEPPNHEPAATFPTENDGNVQEDQEAEAWVLAGPTPWANLRAQSVGAVDLVDLYPEAWGSDFLRPGLSEPDDLSEDKIEREVYALDLPSDERGEMRELLREFRQNSTRKQIMELHERGRTPREIRQISRVRLRCQAIFTEFPRVDLFGIKFSRGHNETIGWRLAETLYLAGVSQRGDLFRLFRSLCDRLAGLADREELARGAISLVAHQLKYPRDPVHFPTETAKLQVARRVRNLLEGRDWPGESSDAWKPVDPLRTLGWARSREQASQTRKWNSGFREYVQAIRSRTGEENILELLCCILQIESPVSLVYLDRRLRSAGAPRGKTMELVCAFRYFT